MNEEDYAEVRGDVLGVHLATDENGFMSGPSVLVNVHSPDKCAGRVCVVHSPTVNHTSSWIQLWRDDRKMFERLCPEHSIGHPDPDQFEYWEETGQHYQHVHGCCGCCRQP